IQGTLIYVCNYRLFIRWSSRRQRHQNERNKDSSHLFILMHLCITYSCICWCKLIFLYLLLFIFFCLWLYLLALFFSLALIDFKTSLLKRSMGKEIR
ncbi:unnamed protein product, partial [Arabidopsis halleri]